MRNQKIAVVRYTCVRPKGSDIWYCNFIFETTLCSKKHV